MSTKERQMLTVRESKEPVAVGVKGTEKLSFRTKTADGKELLRHPYGYASACACTIYIRVSTQCFTRYFTDTAGTLLLA